MDKYNLPNGWGWKMLTYNGASKNHSQQTVAHYELMKVVSYEQGVWNFSFHPRLIGELFIWFILHSQIAVDPVIAVAHRSGETRSQNSRFHPRFMGELCICFILQSQIAADPFERVVHCSGETMSYFYISGSLKGWVSFTKKCKPILVIRIKMKFEASLEHESFAWLFMHNLGLSNKQC